MALEDIPEMQLNLRDGSPFDLNKNPINYHGKFIVLKHADSLRHLIFSIYDFLSHPVLYENFQRVAHNEYGLEIAQIRKFSVIGGGNLIIDDSKIEINGESQKFGKYSSETVRPIIERFAREKFPNHTIDFN